MAQGRHAERGMAMLMLNCELIVEKHGKPYPNFMGKVLGSFFESAVKDHAPQIERLLRPNGLNEIANYSIYLPPLQDTQADSLSFGIILHGAAVNSWMDIAMALHRQQGNGIHGMRSKLHGLSLRQPESQHTIYLMQQGRFFSQIPALENSDRLFQFASQRLSASNECAVIPTRFPLTPSYRIS